jgi:hypothetical protein
LHILIALVVLATSRIMHDSIFTPAPAPAAEHQPAVEVSTTRPSTQPASGAQPDHHDEWADLLYTPRPPAIDDAPPSNPSSGNATEWSEILLPRSTILFPDSPVPHPAPVETQPTPGAAVVLQDAPKEIASGKLYGSFSGVSIGSVHSSVEPRATLPAITVTRAPAPTLGQPVPEVGSSAPVPALGPPAPIVEAPDPILDLPNPILGPPSPTLDPPSPIVGIGDVPPQRGDLPPVLGVGATPSPEPANLWFAMAVLAMPRRVKK